MHKTLSILALAPLLSCSGVRDTSLQITKFVAISDECVVDPGTIQQFNTTVDIDQGKAMILGMVVRNNLASNANDLIVNSNDAEIDSFEITVTKTASPSGLNVGGLPFAGTRTRTSKFIVAAGADQGGAVIAWDVADGEKVTLTDPSKPGELLVTVKAIGHLLDGAEVASNDAAAMVTVCQGCKSCPTGKVASSACGPGFEGVSGPGRCVDP